MKKNRNLSRPKMNSGNHVNKNQNTIEGSEELRNFGVLIIYFGLMLLLAILVTSIQSNHLMALIDLVEEISIVIRLFLLISASMILIGFTLYVQYYIPDSFYKLDFLIKGELIIILNSFIYFIKPQWILWLQNKSVFLSTIVMTMINSISLFVFLYWLYHVIYFLQRKFKEVVVDPTNRLTVFIALFGTVITIIQAINTFL